MDIVRSKMTLNANASSLFVGVDKELQQLYQSQLTFFYKIQKQSFYKRWRHVLPVQHSLPHTIRKAVHQIVYYQHLLPHVTEGEWLRLIGVSAHGRTQYRTSPCIEGLSPSDQAILALYTQRICESHTIQVCELPRHWYIAQYQSLRRQQDITESGDLLDSRLSIYYICTSCKAFKTDYALNLPQSSTGHRKIAYDLQRDCMYCTSKQCLRDKNNMTQLVPIPMLGKMVCCYGKCYVLCPQPHCARLTKYDFRQVGPSGFACHHCQKQQQEQTVCAYCRRDTHAQQITLEGAPAWLCDLHKVYIECENWTQDNLFATILRQSTRRYG